MLGAPVDTGQRNARNGEGNELLPNQPAGRRPPGRCGRRSHAPRHGQGGPRRAQGRRRVGGAGGPDPAAVPRPARLSPTRARGRLRTPDPAPSPQMSESFPVFPTLIVSVVALLAVNI